jgi:hypothetical protein
MDAVSAFKGSTTSLTAFLSKGMTNDHNICYCGSILSWVFEDDFLRLCGDITH